MIEDTKVTRFIVNNILKPIIAHKPKDMDLNDWLEYVFCVQDRPIRKYKVLRAFEVPGKYVHLPEQEPIPYPYGKATALKGETFWVREDVTTPNRIDCDIKVKNSVHHKNLKHADRLPWTWFALTPQEFEKIKSNLKPVKFRRNFKRPKKRRRSK